MSAPHETPASPDAGFTLIEILVVVIIIAIISGVALMSMNLIGDDRELDTERKRLATLIELAPFQPLPED